MISPPARSRIRGNLRRVDSNDDELVVVALEREAVGAELFFQVGRADDEQPGAGTKRLQV